MLSIRCKECHKEVIGHLTQARSCGCPNMATIQGDKITAVDLNKIVMIDSGKEQKQNTHLSPQDLAFQEERKKRKVRKLDFEVR